MVKPTSEKRTVFKCNIDSVRKVAHKHKVVALVSEIPITKVQIEAANIV